MRLRYLSQGKIHSFTFKTDFAWFDAKFPLFIKQLGQENDLSGDFYDLPGENAIIYLTKQQYASVVQLKLLDFDMKVPSRVNETH